MADFDKLTEQYDLLFKDIERKNFYKYPICFISYYPKTMVTIVTKMICCFKNHREKIFKN